MLRQLWKFKWATPSQFFGESQSSVPGVASPLHQAQVRTHYLHPPMPGISATEAYEQQLAMRKMDGAHSPMHPQGQHSLKQAAMGTSAGASQAIYDGLPSSSSYTTSDKIFISFFFFLSVFCVL